MNRARERASYRTLRDSVARAAAAPLRRLRGENGAASEEFWALKDVGFDIQPGEVVGIIGRNGAGKSTLLKILSRITKPTTGEVELNGRVGSLLEVGTGFHPELSGRENIYMNGSILGMSRREIRRQFDTIVDFSGVAKFLDVPVKRYSSGMYVRLAFSVAAHLDPEILVVDEVLSVGDAVFQQKCVNRLTEVAVQGRTVLFVSHNLGALQALCPSAVLMSDGQVVDSGETVRLVAHYLRTEKELSSCPLNVRTDRDGAGLMRFASLTLRDARDRECCFAVTGEDIAFDLTIEMRPDITHLPAPADVAIIIRDPVGRILSTLSSLFTGQSPSVPTDLRRFCCRVPRLPLTAGEYRIDLWCGISTETQDYIVGAHTLSVKPGDYYRTSNDARIPNATQHGCVLLPHQWTPRIG